MVSHTFNDITYQGEMGGSGVQSQPLLHGEYKVSQAVILCLKQTQIHLEEELLFVCYKLSTVTTYCSNLCNISNWLEDIKIIDV